MKKQPQQNWKSNPKKNKNTAKVFILHYHETQEKGMTKNPGKVTFVDPGM